MKPLLPILILLLTTCTPKEQPLEITLTGDLMLHGGVEDNLRLKGDTVLVRSVRQFLTGDFNVVNLETSLTNEQEAVSKGYAFSAIPERVGVLVAAGVSHASVANNHSFDFGDTGFDETVEVLGKQQIIAMGSSCEPVIMSKNGQQVAVLAASLTDKNQHLCIGDQEQLAAAVQSFRQARPEVPLVLYLHWGLEYQQVPEQWQRSLAHRLVGLGADAIIGHHPHVFQRVEYHQGKPIVYSLGNFVADAYLPGTTDGAVAHLTVSGRQVELSVVPVNLQGYFPEPVTEMNRQMEFMAGNLTHSEDICYFLKDGRWFVKDIKTVDFAEQAERWLFPVDGRYQVMVKRLSSGGHKMVLLKGGKPQKGMLVHGELSEITMADIDNNGSRDILLGITKSVNFDKENKKRLNIFTVENDGFRTVWLGTHFMYDLTSFAVSTKGRASYLETTEKDSLDRYYRASYSWDEFGFELQHINQVQ